MTWTATRRLSSRAGRHKEQNGTERSPSARTRRTASREHTTTTRTSRVSYVKSRSSRRSRAQSSRLFSVGALSRFLSICLSRPRSAPDDADIRPCSHDRLDELYLHLDEDPVSGKHRRRVNFNAFVSRVLPSIDPVTFSSTVPEGASPKPPVTMSGMDWVGLINAGFNAFLDHERDKDQKVAIARKEREMEEKIKANDEQKEKAERRVRELEVQLAELRGREVAL
ncbi:hypothetical protein DMC30DRAFT_171930 [Rhodotorula diobovata]|uniref:Uncharacterized protein n=1 Tax=Rhodotorula diobovata TaxID=5288 RepID=A0A5C5FM49_9BASI|nr:hypothetical protein DMC30DRAFT_171930 [Rhodotorula diobovata]